MDMLRQSVLNKYQSERSKGKMLAFSKAFFTYLTKIKLDTRYHAFEVFLEQSKIDLGEVARVSRTFELTLCGISMSTSSILFLDSVY